MRIAQEMRKIYRWHDSVLTTWPSSTSTSNSSQCRNALLLIILRSQKSPQEQLATKSINRLTLISPSFTRTSSPLTKISSLRNWSVSREPNLAFSSSWSASDRRSSRRGPSASACSMSHPARKSASASSALLFQPKSPIFRKWMPLTTSNCVQQHASCAITARRPRERWRRWPPRCTSPGSRLSRRGLSSVTTR